MFCHLFMVHSVISQYLQLIQLNYKSLYCQQISKFYMQPNHQCHFGLYQVLHKKLLYHLGNCDISTVFKHISMNYSLFTYEQGIARIEEYRTILARFLRDDSHRKISGSMQMSMRKRNSHTILQLWCCCHVCINFCILALGSGQRLLYRLGSGLGLVLVLVLV